MTQPLTPDQDAEARKAAMAAAAKAQQNSGTGQSPEDAAANAKFQKNMADPNYLNSGGSMWGDTSKNSTLGKIWGAVSSPFKATTYDPYNPNTKNFFLGGSPTYANELTRGFQNQATATQAQGTAAGQEAAARAGSYAQQGQAGQQAFNQAAQQYAALGGANAATGQGQMTDAQRAATNALGRPQVNANYLGADAAARQFAADQAASRGIVGQQLAYAQQGPGPSAAQAQLQQGSENAMLQNLALARSGRGFGESASALKQAVAANADVQAQTNQAAAGLRAQEAANWRGQQLQAYGQAQAGQQAISGAQLGQQGQQAQQAQYQAGLGESAAGRNAGLEQFYAGLGQNAYQFGQQNQLAYNQLGAGQQQYGAGLGLNYAQLGENAQQAGGQLGLGYNQLGYNYNELALRPQETQLSAMTDLEKLRSGNVTGANQANAQASNQNKQGLIGAGVGLLGFLSDARSKEHIQALQADNDQLRTALDAYSKQATPAPVQAAAQAPQPQAPPAETSWWQSSPLGRFLSLRPEPGSPEAEAGMRYRNGGHPVDVQIGDAQIEPEKTAMYKPEPEKHKLSDERSKAKIQSLTDQVRALGGKTDEASFSPSMNEASRRNTARAGYGPMTGTRDRANQAFPEVGQEKTRQYHGVDYPVPQSDYSALGGQKQFSPTTQGPPPEVDFRGSPGYTYDYKNPAEPGAAPGRQVGPMAQDLTHVPGVVQARPDGQLGVDTGRLTMANTAAISDTQRRNDELRRKLADMQAQYQAAFGQQTQYPTTSQPGY